MSAKRWLCPSDIVGASKEVVLATDYDSLLAVLRQCVDALDRCREHAHYAIDTSMVITKALAAARALLEGEKV